MPTARQVTAAKKKLRPTKKPNNSPRLPNVATFRIIATDPRTIRMKEYRKEMEMHKKEYMAALAKLKKLKK